MFTILVWSIFGLIVGTIAKLIHPGEEPVGCVYTIGIGIIGSLIGGVLSWVLGSGRSPLHYSGFFMSVIGGVVACAIFRWYSLKTADSGPRNFFNGKRLK